MHTPHDEDMSCFALYPCRILLTLITTKYMCLIDMTYHVTKHPSSVFILTFATKTSLIHDIRMELGPGSLRPITDRVTINLMSHCCCNNESGAICSVCSRSSGIQATNGRSILLSF